MGSSGENDVESSRQFVFKLATASPPWTEADYAQAERFAHVFKAHQVSAALEIVRGAGQQPVLYPYGGVGRSNRSHARIVAQHAGNNDTG